MRTSAKKGSLQLSVNAIVVLVLAITMLGIGISFTRSLFNDVKFDTTVDLPSPTSQNPISIPSKELDFALKGKTKTNIKIYNTGTDELSSDNVPIVVCKEDNGNQIGMVPTAAGSTVPPGSIAEYVLIFKNLPDSTDGKGFTSGEIYSCKYLVCENDDQGYNNCCPGYTDGLCDGDVDLSYAIAEKPFIMNARSA